MEYDLGSLLAVEAKAMPEKVCKTLFRQLIEGLAYIHRVSNIEVSLYRWKLLTSKSKVTHGNIIPANILMDTVGVLKITTPGLKHGFCSTQRLTPYVEGHGKEEMFHHMAYWSAELMMGSEETGPENDMWAAG